MTGPEHYDEAERLLSNAWTRMAGGTGGLLHTHETRSDLIAAAQVHATLALAAATAAQNVTELISADDVMRCPHGAVICGLCGYGVNAGDGGRS